MIKNVTKTAESVSPGHPDKLTDFIVDSILDEILKQDPNARVAIDGVFKDKYLTLGGEVTTTASVDYEDIVIRSLEDLGYVELSKKIEVTLHIFEQSPDIALGTNDEVGGAGDQGTITGYACSTNPTNIPLEKAFADEIMRTLFFDIRPKSSILKSDMKSQVSIYYDNNGEPRPTYIIVACQHTEDASEEQIYEEVSSGIITAAAKFNLPLDDCLFIINGTGKFTLGGPEADSGEVGRKLVVDNYGVSVPIGGGAFSGKDATKVDRSAAYMARYIAKNIVAANLADECLITVSYCIGVSEPVSVEYNFFGTEHFPKDKIIDLVNKYVDFTPRVMINTLNLRKPIFATAGLIGHFGLSRKTNLRTKEEIIIPWESLDLSKDLYNEVSETLEGGH